MAQTLFEKIWDSHNVTETKDGRTILYIDRHLIHEVTSPQAFEGIRINDRKVRRPDLTFATMDHNVQTGDRSLPMIDQTSAIQVQTLEKNCKDLGITLPGTTIVCGDSHTSTQGAFGAFALGIGTSDVEHVLATQCLVMEKPKTFAIEIEGKRKNPHAVTAKDIILAGGNGTVIEYKGKTISDLSMEERMTICNMSIEAGARAGLIAPDEKTFAYLKGKRFSPKNYEEQVDDWKKNLKTDQGSNFDKKFTIHVDNILPQVSWGTNPAMTTDVIGVVPYPEEYAKGDPNETKAAANALKYMDLKPGIAITDIKIDRVFIGSCTNSRLNDLIEASSIVKGKKVSKNVKAMVVPGSQHVKHEAEKLGIDKIFTDANFEWRNSGCSMCLGMNPDILSPGERCASTSNRNFEGRQGTGGRTHLVSPIMAAAAAIEGHFVDVREWT
jgi:3-isopropylmalate/(R)-2-methylmalate dehydratase large subunit